MSAAVESGEEQVSATLDARMVPLHEIAPHPRNVRKNVGSVSELALSIADQGLLEPLLVVSMDAFLGANPDLADQVQIGNWVLIAGHRRCEGADEAGLEEVPVIVRDELAPLAKAIKAMLGENVAREGLTPLEEAGAFALLREQGESERAIAEATGVSRGQVHKRLSLLRLPEKMRKAVDGGDLTVTNALKLLELPDAELVEAWHQAQREPYRGVGGVVEARKAAADARRREVGVREELAAAGVEVVTDLAAMFGRFPWKHRLDYGTKLDDIEDPAAVVATVRRSGGTVAVEFWWRELADGDDEDADTQEERRVEAERQAAVTAAAEAREAACARLVGRDVAVHLAAEVMAEALLGDSVLETYESAEVAARWLGAELPEGGSYVEVADAVEQWIAAQVGAGVGATRRAAVAVALAEVERGMGYLHRRDPWTARECSHVQRLVAVAGHELSDFEREQLDAAERAASQADAVDEDDGE